MERAPPPTREQFRALVEIPTRWMDMDIYGHINNVNFYSYFDTAIAHVLMGEGGLDPWGDPVIGFCVESSCRFHKAGRFPDRIVAGVQVARLGRSSVVYRIGIFTGDDREASASGHFVHVFVERASEAPQPIPGKIRRALEPLVVAAT